MFGNEEGELIWSEPDEESLDICSGVDYGAASIVIDMIVGIRNWEIGSLGEITVS